MRVLSGVRNSRHPSSPSSSARAFNPSAKILTRTITTTRFLYVQTLVYLVILIPSDQGFLSLDLAYCLEEIWEYIVNHLKEETVRFATVATKALVCTGKSTSLLFVETGQASHQIFTKSRLKTLDIERRSASSEAATQPDTFSERSTRVLFAPGIMRFISKKSLLEAVLPA